MHFNNDKKKLFREYFQSTLFLSKIYLTNLKILKKCDSCHKPDKIHYRVKSIIHKDWIFCCKECWNLISKHNNYSYGGTRKSK